MSRLASLLSVAMVLGSFTVTAQAAVSVQEAQKLGTVLTPLGGEKAGNADGSIPAWNGGLTKPPVPYKSGDHYVDPFPDDKPLFTITSANLDRYKDKLSVGQIAMFKTYPDTYQMPVYQTRRTAAAPQWVYDNTLKNATTAKLLEGGNGFADAFGGTPFPIPQSGVEVVWNHIARYRGTHVVQPLNETSVETNGSFTMSKYQQEVLFNYYDKTSNFAELQNVMFHYFSVAISPPRIAGVVNLVYETMDQVREPRLAWTYEAGSRRVRRAPTLAYDSPGDDAGLMTLDSKDMFNGAPDRFDWKLVGKREIYIPYNNYKISSPSVAYKDLLKPGHLNPLYTRNELHRVWVVEGTLKPSARHLYSKRTLYFDEDSWQIALADQYDGRGELWRVSISYLMNYYNLPTIWSAVDAFYDLQSRRYDAQKMDNEEPRSTDFDQPNPPADYFSPAELRRRGTR
ncbi:DUF1329 domain-containing protein [Pseudomonas fuscovaginae UPB0736]|uniref:DUF1329 domain-containing protein n=1 Tax=Pseudomonas asplenii TaxID=53407 RepID=A0A1H6NZ54_9PSED|nr:MULTISPECIES: DUF1329 domain-containing protein [Pseudomonas]UUQ64345.1 DUF1329 domain-containing protein [Pseudomonas fuscovaginae UPB0736]UZE27163.1 DUF1329 domain-containing protein [Pseudomonas asplenii]SEI22411.1 Protein of unknown function [Pseudomonas fuscovaginae]